FESSWIFRRADRIFLPGEKVAILGPNGSGKSTFLQIVLGSLTLTEGSITWVHPNGPLDPDQVYGKLAFAAPYLELPDELTLQELLKFHFSFKPVLHGLSLTELIAISGLSHAAGRPIRTYSSGMRQRVRLLLACCSDTPLLVLDEPCSNLDRSSTEWYHGLVERFVMDRTVLVGSNHQADEHSFCDQSLDITAWKVA
ncbi:MAG: ATP-binding cassette domain-containing protein, partial [Bacteroidota bacterium]